MGIIEGFNKEKAESLYPEASMLPAMLMWSLPKHKKNMLEECCESGDYIATKKIDGYFYSLNKTPNYTYLFSRNPGVNGLLTEKIDRVPHIEAAAQALPADTLLIGEIYVPGKTSKDVTRIMGSLPAKAISRQEKEGWLYYYLIDVVMCNGLDVRKANYERRIQYLEDIYNDYLKDYPFITIVKPIYDNIYETTMQLLAQGEEGVVLRHKDSKYECGKRPAWSSIKVKQEETIDVIITGFENPTKEYKGNDVNSWEYWVQETCADPQHGQLMLKKVPVTKAYYYGWKNAIQISAYNDNGELENIGTISSGLTDELREAFAKNPGAYLNKVIEVNCMSLDNKEHTLRHAFLVKFRDDKNSEDCKISEIFK